MTPARFGQPIHFTPRLLRGGRSAAFAQVDVTQKDSEGQDRLTNHAAATFGDDVPGPALTPLAALPPLGALQTGRDLEGRWPRASPSMSTIVSRPAPTSFSRSPAAPSSSAAG